MAMFVNNPPTNYLGASSGDPSTAVAGQIYFNTGTNVLKFYNGSTWANIAGAGGGDALVANPLSQFAATTSLQLAGVISDETGSGALVFGTSPTLTTPTISGAITFPDDVRQTFNPGATNAGLNVGAIAGDPSTPSNGDLWYDSTANELTARINGANVALGAGGASYNESNPILDTATNELLKFSSTASAVNEITVANAATGNAPTISATGGDTNIGMTFTAKGTGSYLFSNYVKVYFGDTNGWVQQDSGMKIGYGSYSLKIDANGNTNTVGHILLASNAGIRRAYANVLAFTKGYDGTTFDNTIGFMGGGTAVASATALPVPTGRVFHVTGTTTITSITSTNFHAGCVITLIFDGALTFTDGNNLKLAGDFVTTADDTITLVYDGTNWYEVCRSVN